MTDTRNNSIDTRTYFEDIGAWPARKGSHVPAYIVGLVLSVGLTLAAYYFATPHVQAWQVLIWLGVLALVQFFVQLVCFLHLSTEKGSRDRLYALLFATIIVSILVGGSLWVMFNLTDRMMPDNTQMMQYMSDQDGGI